MIFFLFLEWSENWLGVLFYLFYDEVALHCLYEVVFDTGLENEFHFKLSRAILWKKIKVRGSWNVVRMYDKNSLAKMMTSLTLFIWKLRKSMNLNSNSIE